MSLTFIIPNVKCDFSATVPGPIQNGHVFDLQSRVSERFKHFES